MTYVLLKATNICQGNMKVFGKTLMHPAKCKSLGTKESRGYSFVKLQLHSILGIMKHATCRSKPWDCATELWSCTLFSSWSSTHRLSITAQLMVLWFLWTITPTFLKFKSRSDLGPQSICLYYKSNVKITYIQIFSLRFCLAYSQILHIFLFCSILPKARLIF